MRVTIEEPHALYPIDKLLPEDQKPLWALKKLSLTRCPYEKRKRCSEKQSHNNSAKSSFYEEPGVTENIPIKYISRINDSRYRERVIYESYKPSNLREMQDYIYFILFFRHIVPNSCKEIRKFPETDMQEVSLKDLHPILPQPTYISVEDILAHTEVSKEIKAYYESEVNTHLPDSLDQDKILIFDSNFECGNLDRVSIHSLSQYNLFLNVDTNTKGHSQWFYFACTNTERNKTVTFNILNCTKPAPLIKTGMKPVVFSELDFEEQGVEWVQDTFGVTYTRNNILRNPPANSDDPICSTNTYYTLTFSYTFKHSSDRVYFAYTRPYSVSMYYLLLHNIQMKIIDSIKDDLKKHLSILPENMKNEGGSEIGLDSSPKTQILSDSLSGSPLLKKSKLKEDHKKGKFSNCRQSTNIAPLPETVLITRDVLASNEVENCKKKFSWIKGKNFQFSTTELFYRQETLSHAFSGFPIEIITISAPNSRRNPISRRKLIFITARVHSAEVSGSFKVEGILNFLVSDNIVAIQLRQLFIFKLQNNL